MKEEKKEEVKKTKKTTTKKVVTKKSKPESDMEIVDKSVEFSLVEVIVIILITGIVVCIASGLIVYNNYDKLNLNREEIPNELNELISNYHNIKDNYVGEVNDKEILDAAIEGMYNKIGDNYSMYLSQEDTESLEEQLEGEYTGVGIEIRSEVDKKGNVTTIINRVFSDSPAERAGLKSGDILLYVDGVDVVDASWVAETIKKGNKESYEIVYKRDGKANSLTLVRERVSINSVSSKTYENVGYIKIDTFSNKTFEQVKTYVSEFDNDVKSIIIDVRDNTGGILKSAYDIADLFVEKGKNIYCLKGKEEKIEEHKAASGVFRNFDNIVVLINEGSASASEVLALALKESANAKIVGVKSFGKGTVQETKTLSSGAMVKITTAYWLSPNGNSINEVGIVPDVEEKDVNKQIDAALKVVK